jgi:hypothetical protein
MRSIANLWECLTHASRCMPNSSALDETLSKLALNARLPGQELSLEATDEGWVVRIFSCYDGEPEFDDEGYVTRRESMPAFVLTIPKDGAQPYLTTEGTML